jgi:hypothetical protein
MPVINVAAGHNAYIPPNTIPGSMHVYVVGPGYAAYSAQVGNGPNWQYMRPAGDTERIPVNNQDVTVGNRGPSRIQLLYVTATSTYPTGRTELAVLDRTKESGTLVGDSAQDAMKKLTAQYYNAVVAGCQLSEKNFQLYQSHLPLGKTSQDLWKIFDVIPPLSVNQYFNPGRFNIFSQNYGGVINHLNPQNGDKFQSAMGDYYAMWVNYLKTDPKIPAGGILALFRNWAELHMPPDKAQLCITLYQQLAQDTIVVAVQHWIDMQTASSNPGVAAFDQTMDDLLHALEGAEPQAFALNSETESSDISHTWAQAEVGGVLDFFWGGGSSSYSKWTEQITTSGVTVKFGFDKLVTFAAGPLYQPSDDPILSGYTPWYVGKALSIGYHHNDNTVWQHGAPTWADTFGPDGDLQRFCAALVVVDGITVKTESSASIATGEQEKFKTAISGGFFPFFEASGSGGWEHETTFNDNGSFTIESSCPTGNPQVLGVIVSDISSAFSASSMAVAHKIAQAGPARHQPAQKAFAKPAK